MLRYSEGDEDDFETLQDEAEFGLALCFDCRAPIEQGARCDRCFYDEGGC